MYQKPDVNHRILTNKSQKRMISTAKRLKFNGMEFANHKHGCLACWAEIEVFVTSRAWPLLLVFVLMAVVCGCGDEGSVVSPFSDADVSTPDELQGQALLENMSHHGGIRVELEQIKLSLITDDAGAYSLPSEIADGEWTLKATYPYFMSVEEKFTIVNGIPESEIETMELGQQIVFDVTPERLIYTYGETVNIMVSVRNVGFEATTISSATSPMTAFAVRRDGETVVGGLFPGAGAEPQSVTLQPGEVQTFELNWIIDNPDLDVGDYQIYGILCASADYPDYFSQESSTAAELNESLYKKLTPATITIQ